MWLYNGTTATSVVSSQYAGEGPRNLINANGTIFFDEAMSPGPYQMFKYNAPNSITQITTQTYLSSIGQEPYIKSAIGNKLYFVATDYADPINQFGAHLYVINNDGSGMTTHGLTPNGITVSASIAPVVDSNGVVYFSATDSTNKAQIWKTDGTVGGTSRVTAINTASASGLNTQYPLLAVGSNLYFTGDFGGTIGQEIGVINAAHPTGALLVDTFPGTTGGNPNNGYPFYLASLGSSLYFDSYVSSTDATLWQSNGTTASQVTVIDPTDLQGPSGLTGLGHSLYFTSTTPALGLDTNNQQVYLPMNLVGVTPTQGDGQSTGINSDFGSTLQVRITDTDGTTNLAGVQVTFVVPGSGAGGLFVGASAHTTTTNASGIATSPILTANGTIGAFQIHVLIGGIDTGTVFNLTNTAAVNVAPSVTGNPSNQSKVVGQTATFTASASGTPAPTVQWEVSTNGGGLYTDVPGATSTTLSFTTTNGQNNNLFRAVFTNTAGTDTTTAASLTVTTALPVVTSPASPTTLNAATFAITGTAVANSLVKVYQDVNNNGSIDAGDTVVAQQQLTGGATAFSISTPLTQNAANNFVVTATDGGANESAAANVPTITEDSTAPALPTVTSPTTTTTLNAATFAITGTAEANSLVKVFLDANNDGVADTPGTPLASQQLSGGATAFSISTPLTQNAANNFVVTAADVAANQSAPADVPTITEDSTAPALPVVTSPATTTTLNAATFAITGTVEANSLVKVFLDANNDGVADSPGTPLASQQLSGGATAFNISTPLTQDAANNFVVTATDAAANQSAPADVPTITEDSTAPALPVVTSPAAPVTVNAATFAITGTAEANSLVKVYQDVNNNGAIDAGDVLVSSQQLFGGAVAFSISTPLTANVENYFVATATDAAANQSAPADVPTITVVGNPTANAQSKTVGQNGANFAITLTGSDPNLPVLPLTYTVTQQPANGTLTGLGANVVYTPTPGYTGPDSFKFKVNNGFADSTDATVSLTVAPAPTIANLTPTAWNINTPGFTGSMAITGGTPAFTITAQSGLPTGLAAALNGAGDTIVFTGTPTTVGLFSSGSVTVTDFNGAVTVKTFSININGAPTALQLSNKTLLPNAGANAVVGTFITTDPNPGDTFTYSFVAGGADNSLFNIDNLTGTLRANASVPPASTSFTVRIRTTDSGNLFTEQTFTITNPGTVVHGSTPTTIDLNASPTDGDATSFTVTLTDPLLATKTTYGLTPTSELTQYFNDGGQFEKYLVGGPNSNPGGFNNFLLKPDGNLYARIGDTAFGTLIKNVGVAVYNNPDLLLAVTGDPLVSVANPLYDLKVKYGLFTAPNPQFTNSMGELEKYLHSSTNSNPGGSNDFILTTSNTLITRGSGILVADFTALNLGDVYANPALLTGAKLGKQTGVTAFATPAPGPTPGGTVTLTPLPGFDRSVGVLVQSVGVSPPTNRTFTYTVTDVTPAITPIVDQTGSHTAQLVVPIAVTDSDPDAATRTYSVEFSNPLYDIKTKYGLNTPADPADPMRSRAKFLQGAGGVYYAVLPDNKLYQYVSGNTFTSPTDLDPFGNVYGNPALLTGATPIQAPPTATLNHGQLFDLKTKFGLDTAPFGYDSHGGQELYFNSSNGSNGGAYGYFIKPDGKLYAYDFSGTPNGTVVADVGTDVYYNPTLLFKATPTVIADPLFDLKTKYGLNMAETAADPARGNAKFLLGAGGLYYAVKPDKIFYKYDVALNTFSQIQDFHLQPYDIYANPGLLYNATGQAQAVTGSFAGGNLTLTPNAAFTGTVRVTVKVSDGAEVGSQSFLYTVTDTAPGKTQIADQTVTANGAAGSFPINLSTAFPDTDTLSYTASVVDALVDLRSKFGLDSMDVYVDGAVKYLRTTNGSNNNNGGGYSFFLKNDGILYARTGSQAGVGTAVATVGTPVFNNPALLFNATTPAALSKVSATISGNTLTIAWQANYAGTFRVYTSAFDGDAENRQSFLVKIS